MDRQRIIEILAKTDHTLLAPSATTNQLRETALIAKRLNCASVCIPPNFVAGARLAVGCDFRVCTVIGFPCGYNRADIKSAEAMRAIEDGADEIDVVINVGALLEGNTAAVADELAVMRKVCAGRTLKVIVETALLTHEAKIEACRIVSDSGADFIKTSTGFASGGADEEDIKLFKRHIRQGLRIKASGGIRSLEQADRFLALGCDRIGASAVAAEALKLL